MYGHEPAAELALDFVNATGDVARDVDDRVQTPTDLIRWLAAHGLGRDRLAPLRSSPPDAAILFSEARRLREVAVAALEALRLGQSPPDEALHGIDRMLGASAVTHRLVAGPQRPRLVEEERGRELIGILAPLARGVALVMAEADPRRLRRCAAPDCGAWFLDTSKGGRRKWCSMATCGNRAKASRHRRRERAAQAPAG